MTSKNFFEIDFDSIIENSHARCIEMGVNREMGSIKDVASKPEMGILLSMNKSLIYTAMPSIKLLYEFLKGSGFFIDLTDNNGIILKAIGDPEIVSHAQGMNMTVGTNMSERSCGTNAIGTSLHEKCPIQMAGKQHFIGIYHVWTCSACPISDPKGKIIGCLNLTGFHNLVHPHTLGLVVAAVESIENQLRMMHSQNELSQVMQYNETLMDSIDFGILSISKKGIIKSANSRILDIFASSYKNFIGKKAEKFIHCWREIFQSIELENSYDNGEFICVADNKKRRFSLNAYPIKSETGDISAIVIILKDIENVYELVSKYSGKNAYYTFDDIIGPSIKTRQIIEYAKTISNTPSTVLIQGESGTGKEVFAQSIHNASSRKNRPFIAINCGGIPKNLIESELFGYEDGAFTGAKKGGMPGKFELANKGTIFLDEIGEMPLDMQVNLLRVLQEKSITRIGASRRIPIDVRVIAATNKNLIDEIKKGHFRQDLYYRLNVIPIQLPPLRERKEDIKVLLNHFLDKKCEKLGTIRPYINKSDIELLVNYSWPGNIRELENRMENFAINKSLPPEFYKLISSSQNDLATDDFKYSMCSLSELEKKALLECIRACRGNISKAAKILQINRSTIYKKMKKYNISPFPD